MFSFVKTKRTPQMAWLQGMALSEETLERVVGGVGAESGEEADGPTAAEQVQEQLESAADTQSPQGGVSTSQEEEAQKLLRQMEELARQSGDDMSADGRFSDPDTSQEQSQNADNNLNELRSEIANAAKNRGGSLSIDNGIEITTAGQSNRPVLRIGESHAGEPEGNPVPQVLPENAQEAIDRVRAEQEQVNNERAKLGEMQNRLDHKINSLKASPENLSAAESRIRDVDMAAEMTSYSKNNTLQHASTAMLAQVAAVPENQVLID